MKPKTYSKIFLAGSIAFLFSIFSFNLLIDPYDVTGTNMLHIKHKLTRDGRLQKINRIKELKSIDNIILGSSRSERLNPATVTRLIGGYTYTFGIGGANIEDALGLLLYLEKEKKLPKNIILCIDFSGFNKDLKTPDGFYKIPEINFLHAQNTAQNYPAKLFSTDALRASIKTFKVYLKGSEPDSYIDANGYLQSKNSTPSGDIERIRKVANEYYNFSYKKGDITFSETRFNYLRTIVSIANRHNIKLHVMLTPVHCELYDKIQSNKQLAKKLTYVKSKLLTITPYYDAMVMNKETSDKNNFEDAVHYNENYGNLLLYQLIQKKQSEKSI